MQLLHPGFLLVGVLAVLFWLGPLASADRRHAALRSLALMLVAFALARPVTRTADTTEHRVVVLDQSASVSAEARASAVEATRALVEADERARWTVVAATDGEGTELDLGAGARVVRLQAGATLGVLLDAAARAIPVGAARAGIAVLSDGLGSDDPLGSSTLFALDDAALRGVPVDFVELSGVEGDLRVVGLDLAAPARVGREATALARLEGGGQVVTLTLSAGETELARAEGVAVDGATTVALEFTPSAPGFASVTLRAEVLDGADPRGGDLVFERVLAVDDALRVAYLGGRVEGGAERLGELLGAGFDVVDDDLDGASVVVLDDRPATDLPDDLQTRLAKDVTDGRIGLVVSGGEASFGPGGYHDEPIEDLLPVEFVQKEEKRDPSTTLVVIIDTSGSMGGNRVQLAKEVSRLAIRRLLPHDKVGLVEFYGAKRWAVPIQPASNSIEIERALNRLDAGGGTVILPAIEEAYYGLKNVRTRFKHVLILTDGGVETGQFEPLLRRMADDGMNVSTVLIGPDAHSEFLVNIANWGQGRFYSVPNRFNLPEILLKQPASAKLPAYRPGTVEVRAKGGPTWWGDVDTTAIPPLEGYVETRNRPGGEVVLETAEEGHPVLASWNFGAGRVTALTTEPVGPGTAGWADWKGQGELLARAVERTAADDAEPFRFRAIEEPGGALVIAEARSADTALVPSVRAVPLGDGDPEPLALQRVAPDRWQRHVEWNGRAPLAFEGGAEGRGAVRRFVLDGRAARELQIPSTARDAFVGSLAAAGVGGAVPFESFRSSGVRTAEPTSERVRRFVEWSPWLALLALLVYLVDIAYRRWPRATSDR